MGEAGGLEGGFRGDVESVAGEAAVGWGELDGCEEGEDEVGFARAAERYAKVSPEASPSFVLRVWEGLVHTSPLSSP